MGCIESSNGKLSIQALGPVASSDSTIQPVPSPRDTSPMRATRNAFYISYHQTPELVDKINLFKERLEKYLNSKKGRLHWKGRLRRVFLDGHDLVKVTDFVDNCIQSQVLLLFLSESTVKRSAIWLEIILALAYGRVIIPIFVENLQEHHKFNYGNTISFLDDNNVLDILASEKNNKKNLDMVRTKHGLYLSDKHVNAIRMFFNDVIMDKFKFNSQTSSNDELFEIICKTASQSLREIEPRMSLIPPMTSQTSPRESSQNNDPVRMATDEQSTRVGDVTSERLEKQLNEEAKHRQEAEEEERRRQELEKIQRQHKETVDAVRRQREEEEAKRRNREEEEARAAEEARIRKVQEEQKRQQRERAEEEERIRLLEIQRKEAEIRRREQELARQERLRLKQEAERLKREAELRKQEELQRLEADRRRREEEQQRQQELKRQEAVRRKREEELRKKEELERQRREKEAQLERERQERLRKEKEDRERREREASRQRHVVYSRRESDSESDEYRYGIPNRARIPVMKKKNAQRPGLFMADSESDVDNDSDEDSYGNTFGGARVPKSQQPTSPPLIPSISEKVELVPFDPPVTLSYHPHPLKRVRIVAPGQPFYCNICQIYIYCGETMLHCTEHNFDVCARCERADKANMFSFRAPVRSRGGYPF